MLSRKGEGKRGRGFGSYAGKVELGTCRCATSFVIQSVRKVKADAFGAVVPHG